MGYKSVATTFVASWQKWVSGFIRRKRGLSQSNPEHENIRISSVSVTHRIGLGIRHHLHAHGFVYLVLSSIGTADVVGWRLSRLWTRPSASTLKTLDIATPEIWRPVHKPRLHTSGTQYQNQHGWTRTVWIIFSRNVFGRSSMKMFTCAIGENDTQVGESGIGDYLAFYNNKRIHSS